MMMADEKKRDIWQGLSTTINDFNEECIWQGMIVGQTKAQKYVTVHSWKTAPEQHSAGVTTVVTMYNDIETEKSLTTADN